MEEADQSYNTIKLKLAHFIVHLEGQGQTWELQLSGIMQHGVDHAVLQMLTTTS